MLMLITIVMLVLVIRIEREKVCAFEMMEYSNATDDLMFLKLINSSKHGRLSKDRVAGIIIDCAFQCYFDYGDIGSARESYNYSMDVSNCSQQREFLKSALQRVLDNPDDYGVDFNDGLSRKYSDMLRGAQTGESPNGREPKRVRELQTGQTRELQTGLQELQTGQTQNIKIRDEQ